MKLLIIGILIISGKVVSKGYLIENGIYKADEGFILIQENNRIIVRKI